MLFKKDINEKLGFFVKDNINGISFYLKFSLIFELFFLKNLKVNSETSV